ncbi:MAG: aromatic amino acid lyase, partial [Phycisphaerales bacterium]
MPLILDGQPLSIQDLLGVARDNTPVAVGPRAMALMSASRAVVEAALGDGLPHYGINTGFGSLSRQRIAPQDLRTLQRNLVRSHAAGVGAPLPADVVRGTMLLLAASLCRGHSGARPLLAESLVAMLNADITPVVPETGSVGASGDLAPLSHIALALIGEGEVDHAGRRTTAAAALAAHAITPVVLEAKEGLALINGTHLMATLGALAC